MNPIFSAKIRAAGPFNCGRTCLQSALDDISWDGDDPVEDPGHPAGEDRLGHGEFGLALRLQETLDVLIAGEVGGRSGNV